MEIDGCSRLVGLRILSRKWSYLVLRSLITPQTFSDVKREFSVITNRTLSQELQHLVQEKLIDHKNEVYSLLPAGKALLSAAEQLHNWGVTHRALPACPPELTCHNCVRYQDLVQIKKTH